MEAAPIWVIIETWTLIDCSCEDVGRRTVNALRPVAIVLDVVAAVVVVAGGAYALFLKVSFEPTAANLYRGRIGSHLIPLVLLAAVVLIVGVVVGRPALLGEDAYALGIAAAVFALGLSVIAAGHANSQLHLALSAERAALAEFVAPPVVIDQSTTVDVTATPTITRRWDIGGQPGRSAPRSKPPWPAGPIPTLSKPSPNRLQNAVSRPAKEGRRSRCSASSSPGRTFAVSH